ncbi:hypothetical protein JHK85_046852 [Glycine max]|nr:hypothetical protein JHK85_046852 [Glycine max]KHN03352.1 hypothetical protein glysoja_004378 [Glycine soja]
MQCIEIFFSNFPLFEHTLFTATSKDSDFQRFAHSWSHNSQSSIIENERNELESIRLLMKEIKLTPIHKINKVVINSN